MLARIGLKGLALIAALAFAPAAASEDAVEASGPSARSEERSLSTLAASSHDLTASSPEIRIPFTIAPGADPQGVELILSATPRAPRSGGLIEVAVNGAQPVVLAPRAEPFEARFALFSDQLRAGENELVLRFVDEGREGWRVLPAQSRLRVSAAPAARPGDLAAFEAELAAEYAAPRRVFIEAAGDPGLEAMIAQGLALRMGAMPIIVADPGLAEITVAASVADIPASARLEEGGRLVLSAPDATALAGLTRAFASRRFASDAAEESLETLLDGPALALLPETGAARGDRLAALALGGAPFGEAHGADAAVIVTAHTAEDRAAALSVLARAALASGSAWTQAWFGTEVSAIPEGRDALAIGPLADIDPALTRHAPPEMRAAVRAAEARLPRRPSRFSTAAHASEPGAPALAGLAAAWPGADGRAIALISAPEGADFARAARRLAHSSLWLDLTGSAAMWDGRAVVAFTAGGEAPAGFNLREAFGDHGRLIALIFFALSVLLLLGGAVNRRSTPAR
ncbi:hypothetical protein FKB34_03630 [Glycocaulis profundi]|nr:hypothetical protein FKB34_03630 [Glycocaulis profundi]